jgi:probable rRNA maturation factor
MTVPLVEVVDHTGLMADPDAVVRLVQAVLEAEGADGAVSVAFVGEDEISGLNGRYRGVPQATDVLAFAAEPAEAPWPGEACELGEVVVCPQVVLRYAREEGCPAAAQLGWTLVHGVLHLLGYDHEADQGEMRSRERRLLKESPALVSALSLAARD